MVTNLIRVARSIDELTFIVVLGDTLHRHETIHVEPLTKAIDMLRQLKCIAPTYLIIGNHDRPNNSDFLSDKHPFNALKEWTNMTVVDTTTHVEINGQKFTIVPYVPPGKLFDALTTSVPNGTSDGTSDGTSNGTPKVESGDKYKEATAIFAHQEIYGAKMGAITSNVGDKWPNDYPLLISGHIHDYDRLQANMIYVGTPMQHAFGDRSDKTVSVFSFLADKDEDKQVRWREDRIDLDLVKRVIIYLNPDQIHDYIIPSNKLVKVVVKGTEAEIKAIVKSIAIDRLKSQGAIVAFKTTPTDGPQSSTNRLDSSVSYVDCLRQTISDDRQMVIRFDRLFA
jgi:DNA repair exonuclease SbcCD nuclease subunit